MLVRIAKQGGDPGLKALAAASGVVASELRALLDRDLVSDRPLNVQSPTVQSPSFGGAARGATVQRFRLAAERIPDRVVAERAVAAADRMITHAETPALAADVRAVLTEVLPTEALRLLSETKLSIRIFASRFESTPSAREASVFGPSYAAMNARDASADRAIGGYYGYEVHEVTVRDIFPEARRSVITHELAHALDACFLRDGKRRSDRADFQAMFQAMKATQHFPSDYASLSASECFAEAAAMYLTDHVTEDAAGRVVRSNRETLRTRHPDLHAFMTRFFENEVPAQREGPPPAEILARTTGEVPAVVADARVVEARGLKLEQTTLWKLGRRCFEIGALGKDPEMLAHARHYLQQSTHPDARSLLSDVDRALRRTTLVS